LEKADNHGEHSEHAPQEIPSGDGDKQKVTKQRFFAVSAVSPWFEPRFLA
jgi:hypothetical protein